MYEAVGAILGFAIIAIIVWQMADNRRHNPWGWIFVSVCWSPFGSMFAMWMFFPIDAIDN